MCQIFVTFVMMPIFLFSYDGMANYGLEHRKAHVSCCVNQIMEDWIVLCIQNLSMNHIVEFWDGIWFSTKLGRTYEEVHVFATRCCTCHCCR